jgi:ribosomal protein S6--L-glutamate ligase
MKIAIISLGAKNYATQRLLEAAFAAGHTAYILDPFGFYLHIGGQGPRIYYEGVAAEDFDVVLPRLGKAAARYGEEVVAHFEWIGAPVVNRAHAIARARNKFRTLRTLATHGLPTPPSFTAGSAQYVDRSVCQTGDYPFIMKPFEGTHGNGILLLDTPTSLRSAIGAMCDLHQDYVIQPFIKESAGNDIRVIIVGGKSIAAMKRAAQTGEFRANIHRGGQGQPTTLQNEYIDAAIRAAKVMELEIAGVDLLQTAAGPVILEVNPSPGFEEIEEVTGIKVAEAMLAFAVEYAQNFSA